MSLCSPRSPLPLLLAVGSLLISAAALAAPPTPAHWAVQGPKAPVAPGASFTLALTAHIDPGWHIYALEEPEGGPIATQIGLAEGDPLTLLDVAEPEPRMVPDPVLRQTTGMFQNAAEFTLRVRAPHTAPPSGAVSRILVRYQSCNDQICLPPHTETITLPLHGVVR